MYIELNQQRTYLATGGKPLDTSLPVMVFLHGSGLDHRCWALQTRWFAFHGFSVIAPDLPGHSLSAGPPLTSIEAMADWLWQLMDQLGIARCHGLIGHSQGGLVALEAAARQPERLKGISLLGCSDAIPVNEQLLTLAQHNKPAAVAAMLSWGFGSAYQFGRSHIPGQAPLAIGANIMNNNPLSVDLQACQDYQNGATAAHQLKAAAQLILAQKDRMTPLKAGHELATKLANLQSNVELEQVGHMLPIEAPDRCLQPLRTFFSAL